MARTIWIGTGWKMNHLLGDAEQYATTLKAFIGNNPMPFNAFILPPFTSLNLVNKILIRHIHPGGCPKYALGRSGRFYRGNIPTDGQGLWCQAG